MIRSLVLFAVLAGLARADAPKPAPSAKDALQPFNVLVGSWKGSGSPEGTREQKLAGQWEEKVTWEWKFKGHDAWLALTFEKGKHFTKGELRSTPAKDEPKFTLVLTGTDKSTATFVGGLTDKDKVLTLTRTDGPAAEEQRLVFILYAARSETSSNSWNFRVINEANGSA